MTAEQFRTMSTWDAALTVGQPVTIRWTNSHRAFASIGTVMKLNPKTVLVAIEHEIRDTHNRLQYPAGIKIKAPRFLTPGWSANNCVEEAP
jgi:hypothetical protein